MDYKSILAIGMTSAMMLTFNSCQQTSRENPLLAESSLPFGAPDFSKIQVTGWAYMSRSIAGATKTGAFMLR